MLVHQITLHFPKREVLIYAPSKKVAIAKARRKYPGKLFTYNGNVEIKR